MGMNTMRILCKVILALILLVITIGCSKLNADNEVQPIRVNITVYEDGWFPDDNNNTIMASEVPMIMIFCSLEELIDTHRAIRAGESISNSIEVESSRDMTPEQVARAINFASLECIYIPTAIPESHALNRIHVYEDSVAFFYLPQEYRGSSLSDNRVRDNQFMFTFTRWNMSTDLLMSGLLTQFRITEEDLIDGKHFIPYSRSFTWIHERERLSIGLPTAQRVRDIESARIDEMNRAIEDGEAEYVEMYTDHVINNIVRAMGYTGIDEMLVYTRIVAINLSDTDAVDTIIKDSNR